MRYIRDPFKGEPQLLDVVLLHFYKAHKLEHRKGNKMLFLLCIYKLVAQKDEYALASVSFLMEHRSIPDAGFICPHVPVSQSWPWKRLVKNCSLSISFRQLILSI